MLFILNKITVHNFFYEQFAFSGKQKYNWLIYFENTRVIENFANFY